MQSAPVPPKTKAKPKSKSKSKPKPKPKPKATAKAAPLPPSHRLHKRPLLHRAQPRTVYVSARTPFVSAVKRAQGLLGAKGATDVTLRASGRAVDRALQVALHFRGRYRVALRTGGVRVVDDVVRVEDEVLEAREKAGGKRKREEEEEEEEEKEEVVVEEEEEGDMQIVEEQEGEEEDISMRARMVSTIEIVISVLPVIRAPDK